MGDEKRWTLKAETIAPFQGRGYIVSGPNLEPGERVTVVDEAWCRADERRRCAEELRAHEPTGVSGTPDKQAGYALGFYEAADFVESLPDLGGPDA